MGELPEEALREFAELYKQKYGVELDFQEAAVRARNFLNLYAAVLGNHCETTKPSKEASPQVDE
jgi:hypothetical protein